MFVRSLVVSLFYLQISAVMSSKIYVGFCDHRGGTEGEVNVKKKEVGQVWFG